MKNKILFTLILILFLLSACEQKQKEIVELFDKEFIDSTENWEVKFHLVEFPKEADYFEEYTLTLKYLKDLDEDLVFHFRMNYGDPIGRSFEPGYQISIPKHEKEYIDSEVDQRMLEEVCLDQLMLQIFWNNHENELQEERFIFKDHQNPQCNDVMPLA